MESPYLDHTNGGLWKKDQCEDMCRTDPQCNSWMWRNSASSCYLSTYAELREYRPNPGYNDHHPHEFWRGASRRHLVQRKHQQKHLQLLRLQVLRKGAKTIVRILVRNSELQKTM